MNHRSRSKKMSKYTFFLAVLLSLSLSLTGCLAGSGGRAETESVAAASGTGEGDSAENSTKEQTEGSLGENTGDGIEGNAGDAAEGSLESISQDTAYEWSTENPFTTNSNCSFRKVQTSADGEGIYYFNITLRYYDCESGKSSVLCSQQGCSHTDASCVAWQGDAESVGVWNGLWYAVVADEESVYLRSTDPADNSREIVVKTALPDDTSDCTVSRLYFSRSYIYYTISVFTETEVNYGDTSAMSEDVEGVILVQVDLEVGTSRELTFEDCREITFLGGCDSSFAMIYTGVNTEEEPLLSAEEYYAEQGSVEEAYAGESYFNYESEYEYTHREQELRLYEIDTDSYELLTTDYVIASDLGRTCYGDVIAYVTRDKESGASDIWLYDLLTGQHVCLLQTENIMEYRLEDGKVICNQKLESGEYSFWYIDIYTGAVSQIANQGASNYERFSPDLETNDYFVTASEAAPQFLRKSDYYADDYENISGIS